MELTPEVIFALVQSDKQFPVDFEDAMNWWDCKTKKGMPVAKIDLKDKLEDNFDKGIDYEIIVPEFSGTIGRGRPREEIFLTVESFKMMGMMVSGERGREIRRYFVQCETELKRRIEKEDQQNQWKVIKAYTLLTPRKWTKMFSDKFWQRLEIVTGKPQHVNAWLVGHL